MCYRDSTGEGKLIKKKKMASNYAWGHCLGPPWRSVLTTIEKRKEGDRGKKWNERRGEGGRALFVDLQGGTILTLSKRKVK